MKHSQFKSSLDQRISSLYVLKAICAFLVVVCHIPFDWAMPFLEPLRRIAVPVFFMITGYFLYYPEQAKFRRRLWRSVLKALKILILVNSFYALLIMSLGGDLLGSWEQIFAWLLTGTNLSTQMWYLTMHLWYLTALFWGLLFLYILSFLNTKNSAYLLLPILFIIGVLGLRYSFLFASGGNLLFNNNALFTAIPCLGLGVISKMRREHLMSFDYWWLVFLGILVLAFVEEYYLPLYATMDGPSLSTVFLAFSALMLALKHPHFGANRLIEKIGILHSANIYYFHMFVYVLVIKALRALDLETVYSMFGAVLVFGASWLFSLLWNKGEKLWISGMYYVQSLLSRDDRGIR